MFPRSFFMIMLLSSNLLAHKKDFVYKVEVIKAQEQKFTIKRQLIGTIKAQHFSQITPRSDGIVTAIAVKDGQEVKQGQVLVQLENKQESIAARLAQKSYNSLNNELNSLKKLLATNDVAKTTVDKVKRDLLNLENQKAQAEKQLEYKKVVAPFSGTLGIIKPVIGQSLTTNTEVVPIVKPPYFVTFGVPANQIDDIKVGQSLVVKGKSAKIAAFEKNINQKTGQALAKAIIGDCQKCKVNESAFVTVTVSEKDKAILIDRNAIYYDKQKPFVVTVTPSKEDAKQLVGENTEVVLGQQQQGMVEILSGIGPGDLIVKAEPKRIPPGAKVEIVK